MSEEFCTWFHYFKIILIIQLKQTGNAAVHYIWMYIWKCQSRWKLRAVSSHIWITHRCNVPTHTQYHSSLSMSTASARFVMTGKDCNWGMLGMSLNSMHSKMECHSLGYTHSMLHLILTKPFVNRKLFIQYAWYECVDNENCE